MAKRLRTMFHEPGLMEILVVPSSLIAKNNRNIDEFRHLLVEGDQAGRHCNMHKFDDEVDHCFSLRYIATKNGTLTLQ